ncbi:DNA glycosylase [Fomitopsis betulina]|nr:DNA glycosylase [Fomitopsis betulina]
MSGKCGASSLTRKTSAYHPAATLFEFQPPANSALQFSRDTKLDDSPRRSKRIKIERDTAAVCGARAGRDESSAESRDAMQNTVHVATSTSQQSIEAPARGSPRKRPRDAQTPRKKASATAPPARWREAYDKIKEMRTTITAPVDTKGVGAAQIGESVPQNQRFSILVSLMLSSQTKDEVTSAAVRKLREAVGGSLSVDAVLTADDKAISDAICKVGFWRRKTDYIKRTAQRLQADYGGDIPKTVDELCSLPGVGPKVAILALHVGWKINAGVGVDVHVHRVTNRLGWHDPPTKTPEASRLSLEPWFPEDLRPTFTRLFVGFGQTTCLPVNPRCTSCALSDGLCPTAAKSLSKTVKLSELSGVDLLL